MSHLPKVIAKARPPRVLNVKAELGYTFGQPGDYPRHRDLLIQLIDLAARGGEEEFRKAR